MIDVTPAKNFIEVLLQGRKHVIPKGQSLQFHDDMTVCLIADGYVKRYLIASDGNESIQALYGKNDVFPLTAVFKVLYDRNINPGHELTFYEALTDTIVYSIDKKTLLAAIEQQPSLYKDLFFISSMRLQSNIQRLENMSLRVANRKVIHQLLFYSDKFGEQKETDMHCVITVPLTHQTLANILNLSRETVTIAIDRLVELKLISYKNKQITILDMDRMRKQLH